MEMLCLDFINSEFRDVRGRWMEDRLYQPQWREQWCVRWGLIVATPPDAATLDALAGIRTLLRTIIETLASGQPLTYQQLAQLDSLLVAVPVVRHLVRTDQSDKPYRIELLPLEKDWRWVMTEIAASFAELLASHDVRRIKVCGNGNCLAVFYDESKSRTRAVCSERCGGWVKRERGRIGRTVSN